jgi:hypothetical protein
MGYQSADRGTTMAQLDPNYSQIVTQDKCTIVTARPLTLTQDLKAPTGCFQVPPTTDLEVFGDEVTIRGRIEARERTIKIFARVLKLEPVRTQSGDQPAELNVDGKDGSAIAALGPLAEGKKGTAGFNDCIGPLPLEGCKWQGGGQGQSASDTKNAGMHGKPGDPGKPGGNGGSIFLVCDSFFPYDQALILSAKGGRGGMGQQGQDGAKGGDGGDGSNQVGAAGFMNMGYKNPTPGGNGGRIVFRAVNEKNLPGDKILAIADRGSKGDPGQGGEVGARGEKGRGGSRAGVDRAFRPGEAQTASPDGNPGLSGMVGRVRGADGSDGADGHVERSFNAEYSQLRSVLRTAFK